MSIDACDTCNAWIHLQSITEQKLEIDSCAKRFIRACMVCVTCSRLKRSEECL